jgi:cell division transport system permease protein
VGDPLTTKRRRGPLRTAVIILGNTLRILFFDPFGSWRRDLRYFAPALASISLVLIVGGSVGVLAFAGYQLLQAQARDASVLTVYLIDSDRLAVNGLISQLKADERVSSVKYVSKQEALASAQQHPELAQLADFSGSNPFPASLVVRLKRLQDVGTVDAMVRRDPHVDPQIPTSYDPGTYQHVRLVLQGILLGGAALLVVGAVVAVGFIGTSIRGVVTARHDELSVMKLVGTPAWMVRGPFLVEGATTGTVAGILAGLCVCGLCLVTIQAGQATYVRWLPGLTLEVGFAAAALVVAAGFGLGVVASLVELRKVH